MIAQRPRRAAPVAQASAEAIPLSDDSVDVALAVLTNHHWPDQERGFAEMRRVARRVVVFTWDPDFAEAFWLVRDYVPASAAYDRERFLSMERVRELVGAGATVTAVPVPHDCQDGFFGAFWRSPEAYLDPRIRAGMSNLAHFGARYDPAFERLGAGHPKRRVARAATVSCSSFPSSIWATGWWSPTAADRRRDLSSRRGRVPHHPLARHPDHGDGARLRRHHRQGGAARPLPGGRGRGGDAAGAGRVGRLPRRLAAQRLGERGRARPTRWPRGSPPNSTPRIRPNGWIRCSTVDAGGIGVESARTRPAPDPHGRRTWRAHPMTTSSSAVVRRARRSRTG